MLCSKRQRGFTLLELLVVVAIIGIIAAVIIPNLLDALQKAKQKRTVSDMRDLGTAWMSWLTDQVSAASAGASVGIYAAASLGSFQPLSCDDLGASLRPTTTFFYVQELTCLDGWKHTFDFARNSNLFDNNVLLICSRGRDDLYDSGGACIQDWTMGSYIATDYDREIVWADGYFVSSPGTTTISGSP